MEHKKDVSLQIVRILAMFFIIICHLVEGNVLGQFFSVGVFIFLILSGYLYGDKKIENKIKWLVNRFFRLMIPIYIFMVILFVIEAYTGTFYIKYIFIYLFDLQNFLDSVPAAGHLWFVSVIMICYFITLLLEKIKEQCDKYMKIWLTLLFFVFAIFISFFSIKAGQTMFYIIAYTMGYVYKNIEKRVNFNILYVGIITILAAIIRVIAKGFFDGSILYDVIVTYISSTVVGFGMFFFFKKIFRKAKGNKIINYLDGVSYYTYITHLVFIIDPLKIIPQTNIVIINYFIIIVMTFISATVLQKIDKFIQRKIQG